MEVSPAILPLAFYLYLLPLWCWLLSVRRKNSPKMGRGGKVPAAVFLLQQLSAHNNAHRLIAEQGAAAKGHRHMSCEQSPPLCQRAPWRRAFPSPGRPFFLP
mgnify:CR=1 FL=1